MKQASHFDGFSFDPFSLFQDCLSASEVDVGGRDVLQALVVSSVIVVLDEGCDLLPEITGQIVVFQQNTVFQSLMPSLDLALGLRMVVRATDVIHLLIFQLFNAGARVFGQVVSTTTGSAPTPRHTSFLTDCDWQAHFPLRWVLRLWTEGFMHA